MPLTDVLDRLATLESPEFPVVSLYLDTGPDQHGRSHFQPFLRKAWPARLEDFPARSPARHSLETDIERIEAYLRTVPPAASAVAVFACAGADDFFLPLELDVPIDGHALHVGPRPFLYPLARVNDRYRHWAVVVADTSTARLFVFGVGAPREEEARVDGLHTRRTAAGGWAQARYQRHVDNDRVHHAREVVDALDRLVREDGVDRVLLAGDEVAVPMLRDAMPQRLTDRLIGVLRLDTNAPDEAVFQASLAAMASHDTREDAALVARALEGHGGRGLGVVGLGPTRRALGNGQVDVLLLTVGVPEPHTADGLVREACRTGARVRFVEDRTLLAHVEGVAALLRFTT
jgi:hypothetical protein